MVSHLTLSTDIEQRWHEDEDGASSGLPPGVLDSLRTVTPSDGYLSFPRFCKGLQVGIDT